jgi:hypothetical protein
MVKGLPKNKMLLGIGGAGIVLISAYFLFRERFLPQKQPAVSAVPTAGGTPTAKAMWGGWSSAGGGIYSRDVGLPIADLRYQMGAPNTGMKVTVA